MTDEMESYLREAARQLGVTESTLHRWRDLGEDEYARRVTRRYAQMQTKRRLLGRVVKKNERLET